MSVEVQTEQDLRDAIKRKADELKALREQAKNAPPEVSYNEEYGTVSVVGLGGKNNRIAHKPETWLRLLAPDMVERIKLKAAEFVKG